MDIEAERIAELIVEACGLVECTARTEVHDPDLAAALELVRIDLLAAAFDTCTVQATNDACGAVAELDQALAALRVLPQRAHVIARAS